MGTISQYIWRRKNRCIRFEYSTKIILIKLFLSFTSSYVSFSECESVTSQDCSIPNDWDGEWFIRESASQTPRVINSRESLITQNHGYDGDGYALGKCILGSGDYFVFKDETNNCSKCTVIVEKHKNVLYSKEALTCKSDHAWNATRYKDTICAHLGDIEPVSHFFWFRRNFEPTPCPFVDSTLQFSYRKGDSGLKCDNPLSLFSSCSDSSLRKIQYEACINQPKAVKKDEQIKCLGDWKEFEYKFLVAEVSEMRRHGTVGRTEYRCYVIGENSIPNSIPGRPAKVTGYKVGISGEATCNDLHNPDMGDTILYLNINNSTELKNETKCTFPTWLTSQDWKSFDQSIVFKTDNDINSRLQIFPVGEAHNHMSSDDHHYQGASFLPPIRSSLQCVYTKSLDDENENYFTFVAKYAVGCIKTDFICLRFIRRSTSVFQMYFLENSSNEDEMTFRDTCFASSKSLRNGMTLIGSGRKSEAVCPNSGRYKTTSNSWKQRSMNLSEHEHEVQRIFSYSLSEWNIGCSAPSQVEIQPSSHSTVVVELQCISDWEDASMTYTILTASPLDGRSITTISENALLCMIKEEKSNHVSISSHDCLHFDSSKTKRIGEDSNFEDGHDFESLDNSNSNEYFLELKKSGSCFPDEKIDSNEDSQIQSNSRGNVFFQATNLRSALNIITIFCIIGIFN